jgi:hypothetical protein
MKKLPQIRSRLRFSRSRPQEEGQPLARLRRIRVQDQVCDERVKAVCVDGRDRLTCDADAQVAEQSDPHRC